MPGYPHTPTCLADLSADERILLDIFRGLPAAEQQALLKTLYSNTTQSKELIG